MSGVTPAKTLINICRTENNILDNRVLRSVDYLLILQSTAANIFITRKTGIVRCYGPFPFRRKLRSVTIARKIISLITNTCQIAFYGCKYSHHARRQVLRAESRVISVSKVSLAKIERA